MKAVDVDLNAALRITILRDQAWYKRTGMVAQNAENADVTDLVSLMPKSDLILLDHLINQDLLSLSRGEGNPQD